MCSHAHLFKQTTLQPKQLSTTPSNPREPKPWTCGFIGCATGASKNNFESTGGQANSTTPTTSPSIIRPPTTATRAKNSSRRNTCSNHSFAKHPKQQDTTSALKRQHNLPYRRSSFAKPHSRNKDLDRIVSQATGTLYKLPRGCAEPTEYEPQRIPMAQFALRTITLRQKTLSKQGKQLDSLSGQWYTLQAPARVC